MDLCKVDSLKSVLRNYSVSCYEEKNFWKHTECPLLPERFRYQENDVESANETKNLVQGMIAVFAISLCSTFGVVFVPLLKSNPKLFSYSMLYLMALAVSALSGAATMVLIPEGLGLIDCDELRKPNLIVCLGILTFFIIRRVLHCLTGHDDILTHGLDDAEQGNIKSKTTKIVENEIYLESGDNSQTKFLKADLLANSSPSSSETPSETTCCEKKKKCAMKKKIALDNILKMKSVGWMTLLGDGAHNFLDGIAMGTSFMNLGTTKGWQITIAILAEEFPHELGDYAVLLQAGLTPLEAVICNVVSGLTCLLGFFVGWKVDAFNGLEVFSWMGGVFLFISLACMLPEVETTISDMSRNLKSAGKTFVGAIAVAGFVSGYAIVYAAGTYISFE